MESFQVDNYSTVRVDCSIFLLTPHTASEVVISLDAEAFGRVEWQYPFVVLEKFGFGLSLQTWIKIIHDAPLRLYEPKAATLNLYTGLWPLSISVLLSGRAPCSSH